MSADLTAHSKFESLLGAYALGALDGEELRAVETHVASCQACQRELVDLRRVAMGLGLAVEETPPEGLKVKVLARAAGESPRAVHAPGENQGQRASDQFSARTSRGRRASDLAPQVDLRKASAPARWLAAAAVVVALASGAYALILKTKVDNLGASLERASSRSTDLNAELQAMRKDSATVARTVAVLSAPDLQRMDLHGKGDYAASTGRAFWSRSQGLIFSAEKLPSLTAGRAYQLWLVTSTGAVSAGMLNVQPGGTTNVTVAPPDLVPLAVAISVEPAAGSPAPTSTPVLISDTGK